MLDRVRSLLPDPNDARSVRIEMEHGLDPGYIEVLAHMGVNNHFGLREANAAPRLGMPEFPYFGSLVDCRTTNQDAGGDVVVNQWDFCGGFHFFGPAESHYQVSEGSFATARHCLDECLKEARTAAEMSTHPIFLHPLYMAMPVDDYDWNRHRSKLAVRTQEFRADDTPERMFQYMERYQRLLAFEYPKQYKLAYARSIDIADYYRRHYSTTPRTVFVSRTDHLHYDISWLCTYGDLRFQITRDRLPWFTRMSSVFGDRRSRLKYKDPPSEEYVLVEDQRRQLRFEREYPIRSDGSTTPRRSACTWAAPSPGPKLQTSMSSAPAGRATAIARRSS